MSGVRLVLTDRQAAHLIGALRRVAPADALNPGLDPEACLARLIVAEADVAGDIRHVPAWRARDSAVALYEDAQRAERPDLTPNADLTFGRTGAGR